jgi:hypothetical protein
MLSHLSSFTHIASYGAGLLIEAVEKYVAGKLLQPWGKVGDHA